MHHLVCVGVRSDYRASWIDRLCMSRGSRCEINRGVSTDSSLEAMEHAHAALKVADDVAARANVPSLCECVSAAGHIKRLETSVLQDVAMRGWWACHHVGVQANDRTA